MSDSSDKLLEMTCPKYLQEMATFNWLPPNVISLERFDFLDTIAYTYYIYINNIMYITNKVTTGILYLIKKSIDVKLLFYL